MALRAPQVPNSSGASIPAPVGGWDAVSALAQMPADRAIQLDNFFPEPGQIRLRKGFTSYATGMSGSIESLLSWNGPSSAKMFAANGTSIYNVSSSGAVGAAVVTGLTNARFQRVNFGAGGGSYLVLCNGADSVRNYDGTSWTTPSITNVTSSTLINVMTHQNRLWFAQKDTLSVWYLPTQAVAGAAVEINLASQFKRGGYLQVLGSWTIDGGNGPDDYAVFITSMGELAVYQGTDPSSSTTWTKVGIFDIGAPIGKRALIKVGGDLGIICVDGFIPLSQFLQTDRAAAQKISLSANIQKAVSDATQLYKNNFGWQAIGYPRGGWALFNIPISENSTAHQYVMNILTGAWCRFTGLNANCWELYNDRLYFGANDGAVYLADDGFSDNGAARTGDVKSAFNYFGSRGRQKQFKMLRALIAADAAITPALELNVDFADAYPTATPSSSGATGPFWDTFLWDTTLWGSAATVQLKWTSVRGFGACAAARCRISSAYADVTISAFDVILEVAGLVA